MKPRYSQASLHIAVVGAQSRIGTTSFALRMAEYFRRLLVYGEIKIYPNAFVADLQKQVKGVGRNVNQIARLAHISGKVSLETLRQISAAQEKIEQQLERLN